MSLSDTAYGPVCAPSYPLSQRDGEWYAPTSLTHGGADHSWQEWMARARVKFHAAHDLDYPHHVLALEAAAAGLGVALAERRLVEADLASGRLVAPIGFVTVPGGFQVTVSSRAEHKKSVKHLLAWLAEEARSPR